MCDATLLGSEIYEAAKTTLYLLLLVRKVVAIGNLILHLERQAEGSPPVSGPGPAPYVQRHPPKAACGAGRLTTSLAQGPAKDGLVDACGCPFTQPHKEPREVVTWPPILQMRNGDPTRLGCGQNRAFQH